MFTAIITPPDGGESYTLTADSRDVVEWELSDHRKNYFGQIQERLSLVAVGELLFYAARREGHYSGTPREFIKTNKIDLQAPSEDDDEVGPT